MTEKTDPTDVEYLTWIAEGRASMVPADVVARLLTAGLIVKTDGGFAERQPLELSPVGLDRIRSSDQ